MTPAILESRIARTRDYLASPRGRDDWSMRHDKYGANDWKNLRESVIKALRYPPNRFPEWSIIDEVARAIEAEDRGEGRGVTKRELVLEDIKIAGYHDDSESAVRVYCGGHVSYKAYLEAWRRGESAKRNGVKCTCQECLKAEATP